MSFRFKIREAVADAVRRVAAEQLDKAIAASGQQNDESGKAVHEIRRCCKRVRAVGRLVRDALAHFKRYDHRLRDTAGMLSDVRDAAVLPVTHTVVATAYPALATSPKCVTGTAALSAPELADRLAKVRKMLMTSRADVDGWQLDRSGFDAIRKGLHLTYARCRKAMGKALRSRDPVDCHEWRKHVKYHAFHMQLLQDAWPDVMQARGAAADELGELLGRIHDLHVYRDVIGGVSDGRELRSAAEKLGQELLERCRPLAARLFSQKPVAFVKEMEAWWVAWHGR